MRLSIRNIFIVINIFLCIFVVTTAKKGKDEDFSEFDDFDQDEFTTETSTDNVDRSSSKVQPEKISSKDRENLVSNSNQNSNTNNEDEVTIDDDDDEMMFDEEEFETPDSGPSSSSTQNLTITEIPVNLTGNRWESYQCEAVMIIALLGYLINFLVGRAKNGRLANIIFRSQRDLLERSFTLVGDDGQNRNAENSSEENNNQMLKESENLYVLWCSGRMGVESMLAELRFIKRQCIFNSLAAVIKSINDTIVYTIDYPKDEMDSYVFCLAKKRCSVRLHRDMNDLSQFCSERKSAEKHGLTGNYQILSEIGEVTTPLIDSRVVDFIEKFPDVLEYFHVSDQYTGTKSWNGEQQSTSNNNNTSSVSSAQQQDALNTSERSVRRVLIVAFNLLPRGDRSLQVSIESSANDYLRLVLHLMDRVQNYRLPSNDSRRKAQKNRQRIEEQFLKNVNQQRQEQAQQRREEKRRAEKEKVMQSDDPDLQRKWEEKEHKREMKRQKPKMKQMKIKSS